MDWLQVLTTGGAISALAMALAAYLRTRPAMKEAETHGEVAKKEIELKGEALLWLRLDGLESRLEHERVTCDERIARVEQRHAADLAEMKGEVMLLRHERVNTRQALSGLFALIKQRGDDEASEIVTAVEEMLASGDRTIAIEKAVLLTGKGKMG